MSNVLAFSDGFSLEAPGRVYSSAPVPCRVRRKDGGETLFSQAVCSVRPYVTGVGRGYAAVYRDFPGVPGLELECRLWCEDATGDAIFELVPLRDAPIREILWPAPLENAERDALTVLPLMQGCLLPNYTQETLSPQWPANAELHENGRYSCSRAMYMQWFGQYDARGGIMTILETRYDGGMESDCGNGKPVRIAPVWRESLGKVGYTRRLRVKFFPAGCDYNELALAYRDYIRSIGELVTLREKAVANPAVGELIGRPIVHTYIWYHTQPDSNSYHRDDPRRNDQEQTFDSVSDQLRALKARGLPAATLHLDGWGRRGYDNQHPDYLPPAEHLGGWRGMKSLCDTCRELGYLFGIHDQYRDYFYDAETFDETLAVHNEDGSVTNHAIWAGGKQTFLCATQAPYYVRRNLAGLQAHGIRLDNAYLDVFSCVELDECFHPAHPMTRRECAESRMRCFREAASHGILLQSEEGVDWAFPGLAFLHHAPHALTEDWERGTGFGIPVPLLDLVYHDCIIIPWIPGTGGFGIPAGDNAVLYGLLSGGGTYLELDANEADIALAREITDWQRDVQTRRMLRHEFVQGNLRRQRTYFEGGYICEIDLDQGTWQLTRP